jgi:hypothetical protein
MPKKKKLKQFKCRWCGCRKANKVVEENTTIVYQRVLGRWIYDKLVRESSYVHFECAEPSCQEIVTDEEGNYFSKWEFK